MIVENFVLASYIAACFAGIGCLTLIVIIYVRGDEKRKNLYRGVMLFIADFLLLSILYLLMQYAFILDSNIGIGRIVRAVDVVIFTALPFSFAFMLNSIIESALIKRLFVIMSCVILVRACWDILDTLFLRDQYYEYLGSYMVAIDVIYVALSLITIVIDIFMVIASAKGCVSRKRYIGIVGILVIAIDMDSVVWTMIIDRNANMASGFFNEIDFVGTYILALGICCFVMIWNNEIGKISLYKKNRESDVSERIEHIAYLYGITKREREIMLYVYEGLNNADISEKLFISVNTVKHHVYNIFEKTGVSSRIELVSIINKETVDKMSN